MNRMTPNPMATRRGTPRRITNGQSRITKIASASFVIRDWRLRFHGAVCALCVGAFILFALPVLADAPAAIRVATVTFGDNQPTTCFSDGFLTLVDRDSNLTVQRTLDNVAMDDQALFAHPMIVMAGEGDFVLTEAQVANLAAFLKRGGFLMASTKCADRLFDIAFRRELKRALPDTPLQPLAADHTLLSTLYEVDRVITVRPTEAPLLAANINGRVAVLYSPVGLNDSANMGKECCCCGANEIRNARQINANALVYAVTH